MTSISSSGGSATAQPRAREDRARASHDLILFDLDGTLSDPLVGIGRSINYALVHFGHPPLELAALAPYVGPPLDETFRTITGISSATAIAGFVAKYRERSADIGYAENVLYAGVPEALADVSAAGVPMAVCTSKRGDFAERILDRFGLLAHFRFVSGGDIGIRKTQQIAGLRADGRVSTAAVMVGDRAIDIAAARDNGLSAAAALWGYGSESELEVELPRYRLRAPAEIRALLRKPA